MPLKNEAQQKYLFLVVYLEKHFTTVLLFSFISFTKALLMLKEQI